MQINKPSRDRIEEEEEYDDENFVVKDEDEGRNRKRKNKGKNIRHKEYSSEEDDNIEHDVPVRKTQKTLDDFASNVN